MLSVLLVSPQSMYSNNPNCACLVCIGRGYKRQGLPCVYLAHSKTAVMHLTVQLSQLSASIYSRVPTACVLVQFCARGSMFDVLAKARSSPLLAQQLDWPKRVSMALDAAKVQILLPCCMCKCRLESLMYALCSETWHLQACACPAM